MAEKALYLRMAEKAMTEFEADLIPLGTKESKHCCAKHRGLITIHLPAAFLDPADTYWQDAILRSHRN